MYHCEASQLSDEAGSASPSARRSPVGGNAPSEPLKIWNWSTKARYRGVRATLEFMSDFQRHHSRHLALVKLARLGSKFSSEPLAVELNRHSVRFAHDDETVLHPVVADDAHTSGLGARWTFHVDVNGFDFLNHATPYW